MRRWNAIICALIMVLLLVHMVAGGFQLAGIISGGNTFLTYLSYLMMALIAIHAILGTLLTVDSVRAGLQTGHFYFRENRIFWMRRISGAAVMLFVICHLMIFMMESGEVFRLHDFGNMELATQILLVLSILVHVLTNIRPLAISFGMERLRIYVRDILLILAIVLLLAGVAFVVYYLRWNVWWH